MARKQLILRTAAVVAAAACIAAPHALWLYEHRSQAPSGNIHRQTCDAIAAIPLGNTGPPYFQDITDRVRVDFEHSAGPLGTYFLPEVFGAGGALFDFDGDGGLDLFFVGCGRSPEAPGEFPAGTRRGNRLYRRQTDGSFLDVTAGSGLEESGYGVGCAVADIDNDGDLDLFITCVGPDRLYRNEGNGTFSDISNEAGIGDDDCGTSAAFVDYDGDGRLDLIVVNYVSDPVYGLSVGCSYGQGQITYCGPRKFIPADVRLYHNERASGNVAAHGVKFVDLTTAAGLSNVRGAGFGVVCADFNGDGLPDLYIANDLYPNRMWINRGNGTFIDEALARGTAFDGRGQAEASMGLAIGDVNGDAAVDILSTHIADETGTLHLNDGSGYFTDATEAAGITGPTRHHTGWGVAFLDLDHDGNLDLALVNGGVAPCHVGRGDFDQVQEIRRDVISDPRAFWSAYADRNLLLMNRGAGKFEDQSALGGEFCTALASARALIYGDIDDDGDLDLVVTYCGGRARVFRNDVPKRGRWLQIRALDSTLRRDVYGTELVVEAGGRRFHRVANPASSYLASHDLRIHFGLGHVERYEAVTVIWPGGSREVFPGGNVDRMVVLHRGSGRTLTERGEPK